MFCTFLPPHMLRHLAAHGDDEQRRHALTSLEAAAQVRGERVAIGSLGAMLAVPAGERRRTVYDAHNKRALPGTRLRGEGEKATGDKAADEAYDGAGRTYDFYASVLKRHSVDGRGLRLDASVHYGVRFDNAMWNGRQMVYGDGDGRLFNRFTSCLDVIGHELTHGVTQYSAALAYEGQPGALNEHFSDVLGILVKQWTQKQTAAKADWLLGAGLFAKGVQGDGVRSMKAPGTAYDDARLGRDPQPAHMKDYRRMHDDNGGVHVNSGIPNHAFYRVATLLGGRAWDVAGRIWYDALVHRLRPNATFHDCATATAESASALFGAKSEPHLAVVEGWRAVGVLVEERDARLPIRRDGHEHFEAFTAAGEVAPIVAR